VDQGTIEHTFIAGLAGGRSIRDGNDQERLLEGVLTSWTEKERLQDLLVERGTERGES
jgi:hypothetical protein